MGKKYIIELLDDCPSEFKGIIVFGLTPEGQISAEPIPVEDLTPYTEPDLDAVRKEAFENGYGAACKDIDIESKINAACQKGLSNAWETVKKLFNFTFDEQATIFKTTSVRDIVRKYSASETIEKIDAYEQEKEEQIQVGDEVITASGKAVVMGVGPVHFEYVCADGSIEYDEVKNVKKTGRTFPEIAEVLRKMKETECSV